MDTCNSRSYNYSYLIQLLDKIQAFTNSNAVMNEAQFFADIGI